MPKGPRGERRPEDPASAAVMVVRLATGELSEDLDETVKVKDAAAVTRGALGGKKVAVPERGFLPQSDVRK